MKVFVDILILICSILNLILFYKVWGMCNDVKKLTAHFCGKEISDVDLLNARIASGDETAGEDVRKSLLSELQAVVRKSQGMVDEDYVKLYGTTMREAIVEIKTKYERLYKKMGKSLPPEIAKVNSIEDLWDIFD